MKLLNEFGVSKMNFKMSDQQRIIVNPKYAHDNKWEGILLVEGYGDEKCIPSKGW
jgi:hypothetical protein